MNERAVWNMQDDFHRAPDDESREAIKNEMRAAGFGGVADTIVQGSPTYPPACMTGLPVSYESPPTDPLA